MLGANLLQRSGDALASGVGRRWLSRSDAPDRSSLGRNDEARISSSRQDRLTPHLTGERYEQQDRKHAFRNRSDAKALFTKDAKLTFIAASTTTRKQTSSSAATTP